jgi:multicomponent Na+:H+ antiporter subunit A
VPLLLGGQVFQTAIVELWLPVFGDIKFVTSTIFDIGVYIVVVGLVLDVLRSLGAEIDEHFEQRHADPASDMADEEQDFAAAANGMPASNAAARDMADDGEPEGFPAQTTSRGQA